jgi:hypothetical protein
MSRREQPRGKSSTKGFHIRATLTILMDRHLKIQRTNHLMSHLSLGGSMMAPNCLKCGVRRELVAVTPAPHRYEIGTYRCPVCASTERLAQRSRMVSLSVKRRVRDDKAEIPAVPAVAPPNIAPNIECNEVTAASAALIRC